MLHMSQHATVLLGSQHHNTFKVMLGPAWKVFKNAIRQSDMHARYDLFTAVTGRQVADAADHSSCPKHAADIPCL